MGVALEDWDVQDDLLLREAVEQGASLAALAAGAVRCCAARLRAPALTLARGAQVRFSRTFTEEEVTARWRALLFDKKIGKAAAIRMGKAERVPRPPPLIGDDMQTIVAAWRNARAPAGAAPPADEPPTFSEVCLLHAAAHARL